MSLISVVVPVYRSADGLRDLYLRLVTVMEGTGNDFEIIFVEDCGGDNSWNVIAELAGGDRRVLGLRLSRNYGQHAATICGFAKAKGDWIVTIDDDLEQRPEDIPKLYLKAQEGFALVYGVYPSRTHSHWRNLTSGVARRLFRQAIPSLNHEYTSFRVVRREIAQAVCSFDSPFPFVDGYLSWLTNNYATVEVEHANRAYGRSNYNFRKLLAHTINIFVTFSDLPLKLASWIGLGSFVVGMVWLVAIVLARMLGGITVSGFASLMAGIVLFGGIQLLILGILGQYLAQVNFKSSKKPLYLVERETGQGAAG